MVHLMRPEAALFPDAESLALGAAERAGEAARTAVGARGRFTLVLSGGRTPQRLYELLAEGRGGPLDWSRVHVFWGDERCVPRENPASNYRMARETLLSRAAIPAANIHPMPCDPASAEAGARSYEAELRSFFGAEPAFDLILLGLGPDGHTASLFPGEPTLHESKRWVLSTPGRAANPPVPRLTLTYPAISASRGVLLLAAGAGKKALVESAARGDAAFPAALARAAGETRWFWSARD